MSMLKRWVWCISFSKFIQSQVFDVCLTNVGPIWTLHHKCLNTFIVLTSVEYMSNKCWSVQVSHSVGHRYISWAKVFVLLRPLERQHANFIEMYVSLTDYTI